MTAIYIIVPILIVAGAFLWMRPSPRDQHLAKLRSQALVNGLRLGSLKVPDTSEFGRVNDVQTIITLYQISLVLIDGETCSFTVLRTSGEAGAYLPEGWQWIQRVHLDEKHYEALNGFLAALPTSVSAISLDAQHASLSWDESDESVTFEGIKGWLTEITIIFGRNLVG
jgi:hypothetical protein